MNSNIISSVSMIIIIITIIIVIIIIIIIIIIMWYHVVCRCRKLEEAREERGLAGAYPLDV